MAGSLWFSSRVRESHVVSFDPADLAVESGPEGLSHGLERHGIGSLVDLSTRRRRRGRELRRQSLDYLF